MPQYARRLLPASRKICSLAGVGISPSVDLITATLDLQLVRMLRQAIRTADQSAGGPCQRSSPQPIIEPRPHVHPQPLIEPRSHIHPRPQFESRPKINPASEAISQTSDSTSKKERVRLPALFQPPWRVLPWENLAPPAPKLKLIIRPPDLARRGSVFDVFI
jgi:hypothetical protein